MLLKKIIILIGSVVLSPLSPAGDQSRLVVGLVQRPITVEWRWGLVHIQLNK